MSNDILFINPNDPPENVKIGLIPYITGQHESGRKDPILQQYDEVIVEPLKLIAREYPLNDIPQAVMLEMRKIRSCRSLDHTIHSFLDNYFEILWNALKVPIRGGVAETIIRTIQQIDHNLPWPEYREEEICYLSLDEMCEKIHQNGHKTSIIKEMKKNQEITWLIIDHTFGHLEIPLISGVWHKGGVARTILKILFNAPWLTAEFPFKDYDILVMDIANGERFMDIVGEKDLSGIEVSESFNRVMSSRDIYANQCFLGQDGIFYTPKAVQAVRTGIVECVMGDHGLYGNDFLLHKGKKFLNPRAAERIIKSISDGKAYGCLVKQEWLQFHMGIFGIISAIRGIGKPTYPERLERYYYIMKKFGQVAQYRYILRESKNLPCENVFDFLEGMHILYPFVSFKKFGQKEETARWYIEKLVKWLRRTFRDIYCLSSGKTFDWVILDEEEFWVEITLEGFQSNQQLIRELTTWLPDFLDRCSARTEQSR